MVDLKDPQQQETEGKLQRHSHLTLMAQVLFLAGLNSINTLEKNIRRCLSKSFFSHRRWHSSTGRHAEQLLEAWCTIIQLGLVHQDQQSSSNEESPLAVSRTVTLFSSSVTSSSCLSSSFLWVSDSIMP